MALRVIKKYPNRRLYDTEKSAYITVTDVLKLIRQGTEFKVIDAETSEDITRSVLIQIITEQEIGATPIFTAEMLTNIIRAYDSASQTLFGEFLGKSMKMFSDQMRNAGGMAGNPMQMMTEMTERNLALWADMQKSFMDLAMGKTPPKAEPQNPDEDTPAGKKKKSSTRK